VGSVDLLLLEYINAAIVYLFIHCIIVIILLLNVNVYWYCIIILKVKM